MTKQNTQQTETRVKMMDNDSRIYGKDRMETRETTIEHLQECGWEITEEEISRIKEGHGVTLTNANGTRRITLYI